MIYEITYTIYLLISVTLTIWVARTLSKNGRVFLIEYFAQKTELADSINHMLVVGFYLINLGYMTVTMKAGVDLTNTRQVFEFLSFKIGFVLIVLGIMHFLLMYIITRWGKSVVQEVPGRRLHKSNRFDNEMA